MFTVGLSINDSKRSRCRALLCSEATNDGLTALLSQVEGGNLLLHCCGGWGWCPLGLILGDQLLATPTLAPDPGGDGSSAGTRVDRKN